MTDAARPYTFVHRLDRFGEHPAYYLPSGEVISYAYLEKLVEKKEKRLDEIIPVGSLSALSFSTTLDNVVTYIAALRLGRALLLLSPRLSEEGRTRLLKKLKIAIFINADGTVVETGYTQNVRRDCALMLSTSGSSGSPKSVMLTLDNLHANACAISQYLPIVNEDRAITSLPLFYSYGLSILNSHLYKGASVLLTEAPVLSKLFWNQFSKFAISSLSGVPFHYQLFRQLRLERQAYPHLRYFTQAGGKLTQVQADYVKTLSNQFKIPAFLMYGQTEATARIAYLPPHLLNTYSDCIGRVIPEGELLIRDLDTNNKITAPYVAGELCYRGPNVMLGYASCARDLSLNERVSELRTGDIAEQLPNGLFRIVGRLSRMIKIQGQRLQLDDIEVILCKFNVPLCCYGMDDLLIIGYVGGDNDLAEQITHYLRESLAIHPSFIKVVKLDSIPLLANGKVNYQSLLLAAKESLSC
ncbi:AMP-binding protein [Alteromonas hispanica]|uniref:AMP-binding protein n=1 Tax=Alteromonas hispanica TaxID=315421 RepID=A0A6L9MRV7_9ALTE|nr:AMP-binding protein [Alteromonas hispanica]